MKRIAFLFAAALLGLWQVPAWGHAQVYPSCSRGVYYCGKTHYISITSDNKVSHYQKEISTKDWKGPWDDSPTAGLPLPTGWTRQDPSKNGVGEGVVIFGGYMVHYAVVFDDLKIPHLICSTYDIAGGKFFADINGLMNPTDITPLATNSSGIYGVAATVFDEKIYVFTNQFTLFTSDPKAQCHAITTVIADGLANYNPLDAITFFPETGPPKVMVLFSYPGTSAHGAAYVIWDGPSYTPLPATSVVAFATDQIVQGGALVLGTVCGGYQNYFPPGQVIPCVQIFFMSVKDVFHCGVHRYEYAIPFQTLTAGGDSTVGDYPRTQFRLFPWFVAQTDPQGRTIQRQYVAINELKCMDSKCAAGAYWLCYRLYSDYLVPQNYDAPGPYGWQGTSTRTTPGGTADEDQVRRNYWSLVGVILGPAPYTTNDREDFEVKEFSNVMYGQETKGDVEHKDTWSNSVMVSNKLEIKVGFSKKVGVSAKLDVGYAHGWEGSYATTTSNSIGIKATCGSQGEAKGSFGLDGWAIFLSPTVAQQDNAVYACDYNVDTGVGTYLNMDVSTVALAQDLPPPAPPSLVVNSYQFRLQDPGGDDDDIKGLMTMQENPATGQPWKFPLSTDLEAWHEMAWEAPDSPWEIIYGTGQNGGANMDMVRQGNPVEIPFTHESVTKDSSGHTNSVKVDLGVGVSGKLKIKGFKVEYGDTLTAGYEGYWTSDTTTTTDISESLTIKYQFPEMSIDCTTSECVKKLTVQPFLLLATEEDAPWIPADYYQCRPWCITWQVWEYEYKDGRKGGPTNPPAGAEATVVGQGGVGEDGQSEAAGTAWSDFAVRGGHLAWLEQDGTVTPLPITADGFDPALGAKLKINQCEFRTDAALGRWTRNGQVWKYKTNKSVKQGAFTLKLDFGKNTWDFAAKKLDLSGHFPAGNLNCRVGLLINEKYLLSTSFVGHGALRFKQRNDNPALLPLMGLTEYSGVVGSSGQDDRIKLAGTLPQELPPFGDLHFCINGSETGVPLLGLRDFREAVEQGKNLTYDRGGIHLQIDFKKKTWSATFKGDALKAIMAPRRGAARIEVKVGGEPWCTHRLDIKRFTAKLSYKR